MTKAFLGASLGALAVSVLVGTGRVAAQAAADPWTRVPAFPTTCYSSQDFYDVATKAAAALDADIQRQKTINIDIDAKYKALDPSQMMQRMQQFMMQNPQRAAEMMQAMNATGASVTKSVQASVTETERIDQELKDHTAKFNAAVGGVRGPLEAQIRQLVNAKSLPAHGDAIIFASPADTAQFNGLVAREDTDYDKICSPWWGASGTFQNWLRSYKTYLVNNVIAPSEEAARAAAMTYVFMDTPAGGYKSTAALEGVTRYIEKAIAVYQLRPHKINTGSYLLRP